MHHQHILYMTRKVCKKVYKKSFQKKGFEKVFKKRFQKTRTRKNKKYKVAYHSACSMQHGQKVHNQPIELLKKTGNNILEVPDGHLCCGSAGTYNLLQDELASELLKRKCENIKKVKPDIIAAGNIGCINQIANGIEIPIVHTIELIDWFTGGKKPSGLNRL